MKQYVSKFSGKELDERLTKVDNIPTKTSELNNDSGFITDSELDALEDGIKDLEDKIKDLDSNSVKKEFFQLEVIDNFTSYLELPKKDTVVHNTYDNLKYYLYVNTPSSIQEESLDNEFLWNIDWDGEGNLTISEVFQETLLYNHFEIYQYDEDIDEILIPSSIPRKREFKTINGQSIIGSGNIVIEGGGEAVDVPTKISQLENDKNYITDSEVQNKLNNLNNTVDYFGDIIELSITSSGGNIDSVEVNEGVLVDTLSTKANLDENGKIIVSQLPDYILGQVMFGGLIYINNSVITTVNFDAKYGPFSDQYVIIDIHEYYKYEGVYFIAQEDGIILDIDVKIGDWIVSTGYSWEKIDNTDAVSSVAGLVGNVNASSLAAALSDITDSNSLARKTDLPTKLSDLEADIEIGGETEYESAIADKTLTTPNAVGGIAKGTKVSDLEGKTFAEMFDDLLFPTVNPTFTAPSASIAFKNYSSPQEVGATGPTLANFTTGYNAGEIKLNGVKQANRGGTLDSTNSFIYVNGSSSNKTLPTKVTLGSTTFKYRAAYNEGPQPKNNKGGNYDSPLAAGTVDSSAITLNGTYPWYASTSAATSTNPVVKQSLVAWNATAGKMTTGQFTVQPSGTLPQVFKLPRKIDVLQLKNALNGNMENVEKINGVPKDYTESTETINIGGTNVTYYVYTYSGSTRGSVTLLAKF